jgi:hypothetical protein
LRHTRMRASHSHKPKVATVQLSTDQSRRDAWSGSQGSSGNILWDAIANLWKQVWPTAPPPNSD